MMMMMPFVPPGVDAPYPVKAQSAAFGTPTAYLRGGTISL
jgi:hypothetical protein